MQHEWKDYKNLCKDFKAFYLSIISIQEYGRKISPSDIPDLSKLQKQPPRSVL